MRYPFGEKLPTDGVPSELGTGTYDPSIFSIPVTLPVDRVTAHTSRGGTPLIESSSFTLSQKGYPMDAFNGTAKISKSLGDHYLSYSTIKTHTNSWNWLLWNFERHQVITGRISRPMQRAGFCVLIGGFPVFLPYGQFLCRQAWTQKKEGQLQSFQMSAFSPKDGPKESTILKLPMAGMGQFWSYNCVVSRDQFIRRISQNVSIRRRNTS
jgi:hypothetical protein